MVSIKEIKALFFLEGLVRIKHRLTDKKTLETEWFLICWQNYLNKFCKRKKFPTIYDEMGNPMIRPPERPKKRKFKTSITPDWML